MGNKRKTWFFCYMCCELFKQNEYRKIGTGFTNCRISIVFTFPRNIFGGLVCKLHLTRPDVHARESDFARIFPSGPRIG